MAYTDDYKAGKPVKINTIIEAVNSQLKNKIQSKIYYWRNNMPSGFPSEWRYLFSDKNTLPELKCDTSINGCLKANKNIKFSSFLAKLKIMFAVWSHVRKVEYIKKSWNWTNGGAITNRIVIDEQNFAYLTTTDIDLLDRFNDINYAGSLIKSTSIIAILNDLYSAWENARQITWTYIDPCHNNCHGSCHGSGGYR